MSVKSDWIQDDLTCKPLDTYDEITSFLQHPPPWRALCEELTLHSKCFIRNIDFSDPNQQFSVETPLDFCHFDIEANNEIKLYHEKNHHPKTLICHDMANGYHDDSLIGGSGQYDAYTFYNWAVVDIFCYFSHHLVTIPPLSWINVAHQHGVKVIGTVITEWDDGRMFWEEILKSEPRWREFASSLVVIANTLKFDGWLLNIENNVRQPEVLLQFVQYLRDELHRERPHAVLIWYDSVTIDGKLSWQNGLNQNNKAFFDVCDGIFTNYSWSEADVSDSAAAAGARLLDVYIGIDVWGRNFIGGGRFNTRQAVAIAHRHGCSLAIFAPAWTHEALTADGRGPEELALPAMLGLSERFALRERALWGSLWPYLCTKLPTELPFRTSFCRGKGKKRRLFGEVLSLMPWYNLRHMQYQPNAAVGSHGYLLSTSTNIQYLKQNGILDDKENIRKWRQYFGHNKIANKNNPDMIIDRDQIQEVGSRKRKMTDVLHNIFGLKSEDAKKDLENGVDGDRSPPNVGRKPDTEGASTQSTPNVDYLLAYVPGELECLEWTFEDSYIGGSCLKINPSDEVSTIHRTSRLLFCDFQIEYSLVVCVVTKSILGFEDQFLNVCLHGVDRLGESREFVLLGREWPGALQQFCRTPRTLQVAPLPRASPEFHRVRRHLLLEEPAFYVPVENAYGWNIRYYLVQFPEGCVTSLTCRAAHPRGPVLLGHVGLCHVPQITAESVGH